MRASTIALLLASTLALAQSSAPRRMPEDVAIFAVGHNGTTSWIDPLVIVHYGPDQTSTTIPALDAPLPEQGPTEADFDNIENSFYKPGTVVSMFSGGEKVGTATVRSSNIEGRDGGCVNLSAIISYTGAGTPTLAANTTFEIPGHATTRRAATAVEISMLRKLAIQWLSDYGLDKQLLQSGKLEEVTSTVLRKDAGRALIGRFDVVSKLAVHRLFAIAEQGRGGYRLTLAKLEVQHDTEDGTDKSERYYIDQLDINNHGLDEVITGASHYESWSYAVFEFDANDGLWREAYTAIGGGC